jgi:hypothetical protein
MQGFGRETRRKKTTRKTRRRWENNIKMGLREIRCGGMEWIDLAQDRDQRRAVVNTGVNRQFP